jgi:hypothetical protein
MEIALLQLGELVVDNQRQLVDVDSSAHQVGRHKDSSGTILELDHDLKANEA